MSLASPPPMPSPLPAAAKYGEKSQDRYHDQQYHHQTPDQQHHYNQNQDQQNDHQNQNQPENQNHRQPQNQNTKQTQHRRTTSKTKTKTKDPFDLLADLPLPSSLSPLGSPGLGNGDRGEKENDVGAEGHEEVDEDREKEGWFEKLILTPLTLLTFLLSLSLVDRRARAYRAAEHPSDQPPSLRARLAQWWDPEPYMWRERDGGAHSLSERNPDAKEGNKGYGSGGSGGSGGSRGRKYYIAKKHRKVWKMELGDAFEMRGRVALVVVGAVVVGCGVLALMGAWVWVWGGRARVGSLFA